MKPMTVRDQPEPSIAGAAADRAEPAGCAQEERRLRADAARNRDAIVAVARDVFAEHGLEVPLEAIAARAGVGIATLYRRFPTREKLVAAALVEKVAEYTEAARQALAAPDPWAGFAGFVERICELQAGDRGLSDLLSMTLSADEQVEELRRTANELLITVIDRAKAAGNAAGGFRRRGPRAAADRDRGGHARHPGRRAGGLAAVRGPGPGFLLQPRRAAAAGPSPARPALDRPADPGHAPAGPRTRLRRTRVTPALAPVDH